MRTHVTFDGIDLTQSFYVSDLRDPLLTQESISQDKVGGDGSIFLGTRLTVRTITLTLTVKGHRFEDVRNAERDLAAILAKKEPRPLSLSIDNGIYWMAVPKVNGDGKRFLHATRFDVDFICHDPVAFGAKREVTVPSGGSVIFHIGGTYRSMPLVRVPSAVRASNGYWKLTLDDGDYLLAEIPTSSATSLSFDCANRVLRVSDVVKAMPADAKWLALEPGQHTLTMAGGGVTTIEYQERWL